MVNFTGLSQGLERGVRLGIALDENEHRKADAASVRKSREQNQILTQMQIDQLKDENKRQNMLRATNETLYHLASLKSNPQAYFQQLESDPDSMAAIDESVNTVGQVLVDSRDINDGLKREFAGFTPTPDGRLMANLRVTRPDGTVYEPPLTEQGSTDPDDLVMAFTVDDLGQLTAALNSEIQRLEGRAVGLGDMSPINARKAKARRLQGIAESKELEKYKSGLGISQHRAKARIDTDESVRKANEFRGIGFTPSGKAMESGIGGLPGIKDQNKVQRSNGMWITESTLRNEYIDQYGRVDPVFGRILNKNAPDYYQWRDSQVMPAYRVSKKADGSPGKDEFSRLPTDQQDALAIDYLKQNGVKPEGTGLFDFGEKGYSKEQLDFAKAKLATGQTEREKGISAIDRRTTKGTSANTQPPVAGAKKAPDGNWYVPDPNRPGKYMRVAQ
ncbi:MAG: hypothetical protein KUF79_17445 [Candidatus Thiodiazotropha sp. (ex Ctena orbiculata)]|nr:hypothetical protein [Candidatus Thiodiazotropha taylori]